MATFNKLEFIIGVYHSLNASTNINFLWQFRFAMPLFIKLYFFFKFKTLKLILFFNSFNKLKLKNIFFLYLSAALSNFLFF